MRARNRSSSKRNKNVANFSDFASNKARECANLRQEEFQPKTIPIIRPQSTWLTVDSRHSQDSSWKPKQTQKSELQIAALVSRYSQKQAKSQRQPVHAGCLKGGHGMSTCMYVYVCRFLPLSICIGMTWKGIYLKFSLPLFLNVRCVCIVACLCFSLLLGLYAQIYWNAWIVVKRLDRACSTQKNIK